MEKLQLTASQEEATDADRKALTFRDNRRRFGCGEITEIQ
jgi:hypothetical protein